MKVRSLLNEAGFGPLMTFDGFAAAVRLADAVAVTIQCPIARARFTAGAATDLAGLGASPLELLEGDAEWLANMAEAQDTTPCGSTELWGSLMQKV